jgi:hypothetical protein
MGQFVSLECGVELINGKLPLIPLAVGSESLISSVNPVYLSFPVLYVLLAKIFW